MSCRITIWPPCPTPVCPDVNPVSLSNGNLNGVGVMDSFAVQTGVFRGVVGDGTYVSTTLDAGNKSIIVSLIGAAIPALIPQATESVAGKGEVATQAETDAGVSDTTFVTPLKLGARVSSATLAGVIELATTAEVVAGSDTTRAVTPSTLAYRLSTLKTQQTWANAAARNAATPQFDGQLGVQLDTELVYSATGILAGQWQQSFMQPNTTTTFSANTEFAVAGNAFIISDGATDFLRIEAGNMQFDGDVQFMAASSLDLINGFSLAINSVTVPADSVLATTGTPGSPTSFPIADFLSTHNQEGWAAPTGTLDRTTFDESTVTLPELAQRVAALITDLLAVKLPQVP